MGFAQLYLSMNVMDCRQVDSARPLLLFPFSPPLPMDLGWFSNGACHETMNHSILVPGVRTQHLSSECTVQQARGL